MSDIQSLTLDHDNGDALQPKKEVNYSKGIENLFLEDELQSKILNIMRTFTYYGNSNVNETGMLLMNPEGKKQNPTIKFGRMLDDFSVHLHQLFGQDILEKLQAFKAKTQEKRTLSPQETACYDFFEQINTFFTQLDEITGKLKSVDFSRLENKGYYDAIEGEEDYAKSVKSLFDDFMGFVTSNVAKYDFLAKTINGEFKQENPQISREKGGFSGLVGKILGKNRN